MHEPNFGINSKTLFEYKKVLQRLIQICDIKAGGVPLEDVKTYADEIHSNELTHKTHDKYIINLMLFMHDLNKEQLLRRQRLVGRHPRL